MSVAYSQIIVHHFNHSNHSSDNRATNFYQHVAPLGLGFFGDSGFLYIRGISIAVTIRSIDPRWGYEPLPVNVTCGKNYSDRDNGALSSNTLRKTVVSDELKTKKPRHRDREIPPTVYTELRT